MSQTSPSPQPFLERLSYGLQHLIQAVIGSHRKPPRRLRSLLNGTWLGHPLHPVITDIPITAWMLTALFDILWLISPDPQHMGSVWGLCHGDRRPSRSA